MGEEESWEREKEDIVAVVGRVGGRAGEKGVGGSPRDAGGLLMSGEQEECRRFLLLG